MPWLRAKLLILRIQKCSLGYRISSHRRISKIKTDLNYRFKFIIGFVVWHLCCFASRMVFSENTIQFYSISRVSSEIPLATVKTKKVSPLSTKKQEHLQEKDEIFVWLYVCCLKMIEIHSAAIFETFWTNGIRLWVIIFKTDTAWNLKCMDK